MPTDADAETVAWVALRRLQDRYADIVTRRAWPELGEVLRPACAITIALPDRTIDLSGPDGLAEFIAPTMAQFSFFQFVILNTVFDIEATAGTAAARMFMQEARQSAETGRRADTFGVYHDRFERDDGGRWWFASRHYRTVARTSADGDTDLTVFDLGTTPLDEI